jgi:predicted NAD/FAD-binding protein
VKRISAPFIDNVRLSSRVQQVRRNPEGVEIEAGRGWERFDHVVMASHADQSLAMLADADPLERELLGAFPYRHNEAVLHSDTRLMPRRRKVWSAWNYAARRGQDLQQLSVTYWMNRLQHLPTEKDLFVTLNPLEEPDPALVIRRERYDHPVFDVAAGAAQRRLWSLQGRRRTWFSGAWFGAGFHEDGLQSGLAVAEQLGGVRRPWTVPDESGRIHVTHQAQVLEPA